MQNLAKSCCCNSSTSVSGWFNPPFMQDEAGFIHISPHTQKPTQQPRLWAGDGWIKQLESSCRCWNHWAIVKTHNREDFILFLRGLHSCYSRIMLMQQPTCSLSGLYCKWSWRSEGKGSRVQVSAHVSVHSSAPSAVCVMLRSAWKADSWHKKAADLRVFAAFESASLCRLLDLLPEPTVEKE